MFLHIHLTIGYISRMYSCIYFTN